MDFRSWHEGSFDEMGRSVICEAYLEEYLKSLAKRQGTSVGLLIGQVSVLG